MSDPNPQDWYCAYRAANNLEANLVKGLLTGAGIDAVVHGEHLSSVIGELPPTDTAVRVMVKPRHQDEADTIVADYNQQQRAIDNGERDWTCGHCGESNSGHFEICWQCQKEPDESSS